MNGYICDSRNVDWQILAVNHIEYLKHKNQQAGAWSGTLKGRYTSSCGDR